MDIFEVELDTKRVITVPAKSKAAAEKYAEVLIDGGLFEGKVKGVRAVPPPKPDNSYIEQDDGYLFTAWGIHVAAKSLDEAKKIIKRDHGKDVDKDIPPPKQEPEA